MDKGWDSVAPEMREWQMRGFSEDEARRWRSLRIISRIAEQWRDAGFEADDAAEWRRQGFDLEQAVAWSNALIDTELDVVDAARLRKAGMTADEAYRTQGGLEADLERAVQASEYLDGEG